MLSLLLSPLGPPVAYSLWDDAARRSRRTRGWLRRRAGGVSPPNPGATGTEPVHDVPATANGSVHAHPHLHPKPGAAAS